MGQSSRKVPRPSGEQLARAKRYIKKADARWKFAATMPQWPHEYILREWGNAREFDFVERLIAKYGYKDVWTKGRPPRSYLVIGTAKF